MVALRLSFFTKENSPMAKQKKKPLDLERFGSIRARIVDLYQYSGQAIRDKKTLSTSAIVFAEQKWLVDEIERVAEGPIDEADIPRFSKVKAWVVRTYNEHEGAIRSGEFIKVSAAIFGMSRFLVKCLERIAYVIDEEAAEALAAAAPMPSAKTNRVEVTIDEALIDTPEETEAAIANVGGIVVTDGSDVPDDDLV